MTNTPNRSNFAPRFSGTGLLQVWATISTSCGYYLYRPTIFVTEYHMAGDPLLTWGNFELVGKGPLLGGASHCADLDQPNWRTRM